MNNEMRLTWNGHACFTAEYAGYRIVLDPYSDGSVPGFGPLRLKAEAVLMSHGHGDHAFADAVALQPAASCPWTITEIATFHDPFGGAKRGKNIIRILEAGGLRVAHLGDLGCELEPEQLELLKGLDAVMIPVGGFYTIDAAEAQALLEKINARVVIPMHYRLGNDGLSAIGTLDTFLAYRNDIVKLDGPTLVLTKDTPKMTAVPVKG